MKNIHIENSYSIWKIPHMQLSIQRNCFSQLNSYNSEVTLNRSYLSMYIEWWLHNIGYYITKPFCFIKGINGLNSRCKDVDLQEWL